MFANYFFFPACLVTSIVCTCQAHHRNLHLHQHRWHYAASPVEVTAVESTSSRPPGFESATTCQAAVSQPTGVIQDDLLRRVQVMDDGIDTIQNTADDFSQVSGALNTASSEAIDFMIQLFVSIESLSSQLSSMKTEVVAPASSDFSTMTSHPRTGSASPNKEVSGTKRPFLNGNTLTPGLPTTRQAAKVDPEGANRSISPTSLSDSLSTQADLGSDLYATSATIITSTSTVTVTIKGKSLKHQQFTQGQIIKAQQDLVYELQQELRARCGVLRPSAQSNNATSDGNTREYETLPPPLLLPPSVTTPHGSSWDGLTQLAEPMSDESRQVNYKKRPAQTTGGNHTKRSRLK
ncbi:hypothetical protein F5Y17DRAFT_453115 [Xylariaceae sp. FL0594]|nr:hypothetical protein F5Y17DRAFT_453115 [Xylariaceae sp. FL0594]